MPVFGREDADLDYMNLKGMGGSSQGPAGGTGTGSGGGGGALFGPSGGFGGFNSGPTYDRSVPQYGYRRLPFGPMFNQRTTGPAGNDYAAMARQGMPSWQQGNSGPVQVGPGAQGMASPGYAGPVPPGAGGPMPAQQMGGFAPQGNATGGFTPGNPWGPYGGDQRGDLLGAMNRIFGQAGQAGTFDPNGNPALLQQIGQMYAQQAGGRQAGIRNSLLAGGADDPNAFAYGSLMGDLGLQHDLSGAQSNAQLQSMMQNQGWNQNFANQLFGGALGNQQMYAMMNRMPSPNNGLGGLLGSLAGPALGAMLPGLGSLFGSGIPGGQFDTLGGIGGSITPDTWLGMMGR